jgi:hypothetical protein
MPNVESYYGLRPILKATEERCVDCQHSTVLLQALLHCAAPLQYSIVLSQFAHMRDFVLTCIQDGRMYLVDFSRTFPCETVDRRYARSRTSTSELGH